MPALDIPPELQRDRRRCHPVCRHLSLTTYLRPAEKSPTSQLHPIYVNIGAVNHTTEVVNSFKKKMNFLT